MFEAGSQAKDTPGLEDYIAAVRQRKWLIVVCGILGLVAAFALTIASQNNFEASARVLVNPTPVGAIDGRLVSPTLEREREVVDSIQVAREVGSELGLTANPNQLLREFDVVFVADSDTLELNFSDPDPQMAQDVVNSFAQQYVALRNGQAADLDAATIGEFQGEVETLAEAIAISDAEIADLERQRNVADPASVGAINVQITEETRERTALRNDLRVANSDLSDARIAANTRTAPAVFLQQAELPGVPTGFSDNIVRALGLVLGVGAGAALAFVLQRLDRTARESADVELALGTSVLASIPSFGISNRGGASSVVMLSGGRSTRVQRAREAFRRLRSSVQFLGATQDAKTFLITSALPTEGKSTTSVNLAVALSQGETSVCLVNADLRRPTVEKILGIPSNQQGLSDWLANPDIANIMIAVPGTPGLAIVPAGPPPSNPGELLATNRFASLLDELSDQFDIVLIDAPPVLSTADAAAIARSVDGTIVVVDSSRTDTDTLLRVRAEIDRSGGTVLGAILNRDNSGAGGGSILRKDRYAYEKVTASRADR